MINLANMSQMAWRKPCAECGIPTQELYMVSDEVWLSVMPSKQGFLHFHCLESRLGRKLVDTDFPMFNEYIPICNAMLLAEDWSKKKRQIIRSLAAEGLAHVRNGEPRLARKCHDIIRNLRMEY